MASKSVFNSLKLRIDWSELDSFGHVNNVSFFKYIQAARINYWEAIGVTNLHKEEGIGPMLVSCKCDFKHPLFYPGEVKIKSHVQFIKNTSFGISHQLLNKDDKLVAEAQDIIVLYNFKKEQKSLIPVDIKRRIEALEQKKF